MFQNAGLAFKIIHSYPHASYLFTFQVEKLPFPFSVFFKVNRLKSPLRLRRNWIKNVHWAIFNCVMDIVFSILLLLLTYYYFLLFYITFVRMMVHQREAWFYHD